MQKNTLLLPKGEDIWEKLAHEERPIAVYGMGNGADKLFAKLAEIGKKPVAVFASDGFVRGQSFRGYRVQSLSEIEAAYPDFVILVSFASRLPGVMEMIFALSERHTLYLPDMPVMGESYFTRVFMEEHAAELAAVHARLADEQSRSIFSAVISYKITGDVSYLKNACSTPEEEYALLSDRALKRRYSKGNACRIPGNHTHNRRRTGPKNIQKTWKIRGRMRKDKTRACRAVERRGGSGILLRR